MTKHDAIKAYFEPKIMELAGDLPGFNFSPDEQDAISIVTNYSEKIRKKYVRAAEKEYGFSVLIVKAYSTNHDDLNLEAMNFAQAFMDWLEEQNAKKTFPDFGPLCQVLMMENLQNMPNLSGINPDENLARYMIQCRVIYFEKGR